MSHLIQRRCNQPAQSDHIHVMLPGSSQNLLRGIHDADIDHFIVVTSQNNGNYIFSDIVYIPLYGSHQDPSFQIGLLVDLLLRFDIGYKHSHPLLVTPALFTTLRENNLPDPKTSPTIIQPSTIRPCNTTIGPASLLI